MRGFIPLAVVVGLTLCTPDAFGQSAASFAAGELERRVEQLGSRRFREREAAIAYLSARPTAAVAELLRRAADHRDPEVRRRAGEILAAVERTLESARVLEPMKLRLDYKGMPVPDAVADFAARSGIKVTLDAAYRTKLAGRAVTLDTGEVGCWEALRQLCEKAGLTENVPAVSRERDLTEYDQFRFRGRRVAWWGGKHLPSHSRRPEQEIVLRDGGEARPAFIAGALRVQALEPPGVNGPPGPEAKLVLHVDTDPRLGWGRLVGARVDGAVDDRGQALRPRKMMVGDEPRHFGNEEAMIVWESDHVLKAADTRQGTVRLAHAEKPSKRIAELRGTLWAEVEAPAAALVTVADVMAASGKSFAGPDGTLVRVREAAEDEGQYKVIVEVRRPPPPQPAQDQMVRLWMIQAQPAGATVNLSGAEVDQEGLSLLDAAGQPFLLATGHHDGHSGQDQPRVYELYYQPRRDQGPPARLVLTGRRHALVEVPFVLKDILLP